MTNLISVTAQPIVNLPDSSRTGLTPPAKKAATVVVQQPSGPTSMGPRVVVRQAPGTARTSPSLSSVPVVLRGIEGSRDSVTLSGKEMTSYLEEIQDEIEEGRDAEADLSYLKGIQSEIDRSRATASRALALRRDLEELTFGMQKPTKLTTGTTSEPAMLRKPPKVTAVVREKAELAELQRRVDAL